VLSLEFTMRIRHWFFATFLAVLLLACVALGDQPGPADYRSPEQAITTTIVKGAEVTSIPNRPFLGIEVAADASGRLVVAELAASSPAAKAGVRKGDKLVRIGGVAVSDETALQRELSTKLPGDQVTLTLVRQDVELTATAVLAALSKPAIAPKQQTVSGLEVAKAKEGPGLAIEKIVPDSPAAKADLKVGDVIVKVDGTEVSVPAKLSEIVAAKKPGESITLAMLRGPWRADIKVVLANEQVGEKQPGGWDDRQGGGKGGKGGLQNWKKGVYRLAIICIEYPDQKHHPKITSAAWEDSLFSTGTYTKTNATGDAVHGSVNDLYMEQSFGKLRIEGKCFDFVEVSKKRTEYGNNNSKAILTEACDKLVEREGKEALANFDGVFFLYAGGLPPGTKRGGGSLYWPHRANFNYQGKGWPYFICPELNRGPGGDGAEKMYNTSVFAHEFGHMVGLPDLYARPEQPNIVGLWQWCLMSNQVANGRPQHASAWCKERLGWIEPAIIDPTVKQKLVLRPVQDSPKECFKVLIHRDGSEYLLLENRAKKGFDKSLPGEGLLIWRVVRGQPILEESHGIDGPSAPSSFPTSVPYPSAANDAFTPYTVPSSRSRLGGGLPVYITNIKRLSDGRISFHIGYEYQ
jgi:M6 family metalloprotease-like protein